MNIMQHLQEHAKLGVPLKSDLFVQSKPENTIAIIGDSFVFRDHPAPDTGVGSVATNVSAPFTVVNCLLGQRFKPVNLELGSTAGVNGNTFAQILARFDSEILSRSSRYVWIHGTLNSTNNGVSSASQIADITSMINKCKAARRIVIITTVPPSTLMNTTAKRQVADEVNEFICSLEYTYKDVIVVRYDGAYIDNTLLTFQPRSDATTDGTHMNANGAIWMAHAAFLKLDPLIPKAEIPWANGWETGMTNGRSIDPNPINVGTGGTITANCSGQVMDAYQIGIVGGGTAVASKVARTDGHPGTWQRVVHTCDATLNDAADGFQISSISYAALHGLAVGDWFECYCEIRIPDAAYLKAPRFMVLFQNATSERAIAFENGSGTGFMKYTNGELNMVVKTPKRQVPVGATGIKIYMEAYSAEANQSFTIDFGRHVIVKVAA